MRRRDFLILFGGAAATLPAASWPAARAAGQVARVGLLTLSAPAEMIGRLAAFRDGMHELGYREGQNIVFEPRFAEGRADRLTALTAQLLQAHVDVIVTSGHPAIRALQQASSTTPIVAAIMSDPVEEGFAASYARPGGNITGLAFQDAELITKRLEILKEMVPSLSHVAALWDPGMPPSLLTATESTARALGLTLKVLPAGNLTEIGKAFDALGSNAQALFEISSPRFAAARVAIATSALKKGLPAACEEREFAAAGCLVSYGPSFAAMFGRAAYYVDKILKGSRPADLPIEQPTKFELVINLKTAKALGLIVAPGLLSRADEVIE
jgi:putative ABC transport system substrate-binding protein